MLSALKVKKINQPGKYSDGNGLYLKVTKSLSKSWVFRYSFQKKRRELGLGSVTYITLLEARQKALEYREMIFKGIDPKTARKQDSGLNFKDYAYKFIEMKSPTWSNEKHIKQWRYTLEEYAFPFIGDLKINMIDTRLILSMLEPIWTKKPETASRVRGRVERIIDYAITLEEMDKANPARRERISILLPQLSKIQTVKHHSAVHYNDMSNFWRKLEQHNSVNARAMRFTILTACRTGEAIPLHIDEIQGDVWVIPENRTKSKREHRVPLCDYLVDMISNMHTVDGFYFPSSKMSNKYISNIAMLNFLKKTMGFKGFTVHGFRSTFRDWVAEKTEFDSRLAEASLAHVLKDKTEAAYQRGDLLEKRRVLMQAWCDYVISS